jgi:membrane fusion protein (multidrug efflux system)
MRGGFVVIVAVCAVLAPAHAQQAAPAAIPVGVVAAERKPITKTSDLVGRIEAINRVQIVARVTGYLEAVLFKEGDLVKEGAPLYRIEHGLFQAALEQAQGALERSKAAKTLSEIQLQRAEQLVASQSGTVVARDQARAADQQANGQVLSDESAVETAKINLGYTDITAPIAGRIGRTSITKGNVVGPNNGSLTVLVSQDPMYITFPVSQRDILQAQKTGVRPADVKSIKVRIRFSDGSTYDQTGEINFFDVTVDRATDTVLARATIANPNGMLIDGQFVRVVLESGAPEEKIVVPQAALIADQAGI